MRITGFELQLTNSLKLREAATEARSAGRRNVEGTVTAYFESPDLVRRFEEGQRRQENWLLRVVRPHMPKRMFQRLRGRMRAARRAA